MGKIKTIFQNIFRRQHHVHQLNGDNVDELFNELGEIQLKKQRIARYMEELKRREQAHKQYERLDQEAVTKINALAQKAKDIEEKKNHLKGRLISNNAALNRLSKYEEELPQLIKEMQIGEKRQRETESQIMYLQDERSVLEEERESLITGYRFLQGFSIVMVIIIGVCLLVSFIMLQILREKIWYILSGVVIVTMLFVVGVVLTKEKMEKEIGNNEILQKKAAKYLNKAKIRLVNQTKYLEYQYHKLGVDSAAKLELYYNRYLKNKNNEKSYLKLNDQLTDIEEKILDILHSKDILLEDIGELADWILQPKRLQEMKMIDEDREKTEEQLTALTAYEEELWKEIMALAQDERLKDQIDEKIKAFNGENSLDKSAPDA